MKKKTEIQQIDFYGILSRETKVISNSNSNPVVMLKYKRTPLNTCAKIILCMGSEIRSQIHGYNTNPNSVFIRRLNTTEEFENFEDEFDEGHEIDIIEEGWAYQHCGNWTQMKPDRINGQNDANSEKIALYALKELTKMAVTYHETPDSSEKKVFDYIIKTINKQPETEEFKHVADWSKFGEIFNQPYQLWDSNEKMHNIFNKIGDTFDQWAGDSFCDFQLVEQLDYIVRRFLTY